MNKFIKGLKKTLKLFKNECENSKVIETKQTRKEKDRTPNHHVINIYSQIKNKRTWVSFNYFKQKPMIGAVSYLGAKAPLGLAHVCLSVTENVEINGIKSCKSVSIVSSLAIVLQ